MSFENQLNTLRVRRRNAMGCRTAVFAYISVLPRKHLAQSQQTINICWVSQLIALLGEERVDTLHAASESPCFRKLMRANE